MNPDDPEQYIRDHERGVGETPRPTPQPRGTVAKILNAPRGRLLLVCAVAAAIAIAAFLGQYAGGTTVHGNLTMINNGTKDTIDCNNGNLRLFGDDNAVIYHSGSPTINKIGNNNTVWQSQSVR